MGQIGKKKAGRESPACMKKLLLFCCVPVGSARNCGAEGHQGKFGDLEALFPEGDADDRDAVDHSADRSAERQWQARDQEPDDIQDQRTRTAAVFDILAEGEEAKTREFKTLQSPGDTDDRDAPEDACQEPFQPHDDAAQNKP